MSRDQKERLLRGDDRARTRDADGFDPVVEGQKRGLSPERSRVLWEEARATATDTSGWLDGARAQAQFYALMARAVEGASTVGRVTRVGVELDHEPWNDRRMQRPAPQVPGRDTRVLEEMRAQVRAERAASPAAASEQPGSGVASSRVPQQDGGSAILPAQPGFIDASVGDRMSRLFGVDVTRVAVVLNSPAATGATKAVTKDGAVHFRAGAYRPGTREGDWLIAHELAHVVQQRGDRSARPGTTKEIEREADRAASLAVRGRAAPLALRAQPSVAYAFSEGEAHDDADVGEHEPPDRAEAHGPGAAAEPAQAAHAPTSHPEAESGASAHEAAEPAAPDGLADIGAVLPAEDAPAAAPAGGGGAAPKPNKPVPSVATAKPEQGLALLRGVRPDRIGQLFGQVRTANSADVAKTRAEQHANPPKQMSTGASAAPATKKTGGPDAAPPSATEAHAAHSDKAGEGKAAKPIAPAGPEAEAAKQTKQAKQTEAAAQREAVTQVVASVKRQITSWFSSWFGHGEDGHDKAGEKVSDKEAREVTGSIDKISTSTSGVSTETGPAPTLAMKQEAQGNAGRERAELEKTIAAHETLSRADSRAPMGEDHIEPGTPAEQLTATPSAAGPGGAAATPALPTLAGAAASEEAGIVAQEQHGAEVDIALAKASADVTAERGKHDTDEAKARADSDAQIQTLKTKADAEETAARTTAQADVAAARGQWQAEIDRHGADARKKGDQKVSEGLAQVAAEEAKANAEAKQHIDEGKQKADAEKQKGEKEAADAKAQGKEKSSGVWGWVKSKARAAVDGIKKAVSAAIDACRRAVKAVIAAAKKLAMAVIEAARKVITAVIKAVGDALIAISGVLLAAFPGLKAKFQAAIKKAVDVAVSVVNKIADGLKKAVQKALDALGAALDKALQLLEKGISAIIDAATKLVEGVIKAAQAVVAALGTWAKIIKDVASGPGAWIKNLGAAVVDGIKNHLWAAFKTAVVEWFKGKVFELLGVGGIILELLLEGGLTREHIVQMALDALMVAIPAALVAILVEKLVSMIVPAAGAVMAIIEGLQAAWGTISRIIAAFSAFVGFLLAVKSGSAGPLFAGLLAAAAIVVLDFVSNWMLKKLAGAARKVGAKLKGLAEKFKAKRKAKKDAKASKHHDEHDPKSPGKHDDHPDKSEADRKKKEEKDKKNQEILGKAQRELPPKVDAVLRKRPGKLLFRARLAAWRIQYRLTSLQMIESGNAFTLKATVNPSIKLPGGFELEILKMLRRVGERVLRENPAALERAAQRAGELELDPTKSNSHRVYAPRTAEERIALAVNQKKQQPERDHYDSTLVDHGSVADGGSVQSAHKKPGPYGQRVQGDELVVSIHPDGSPSIPKRYAKLAEELEKKEPPITPHELGRAMRLMSRGLDAPSFMKGSEKELGELMGLFFGTEPSRDGRNAVFSMMAIEQMEAQPPGKTLSETFTKLPAQMKGHVRAAEGLNTALDGGKRDTRHNQVNINTLVERQLAQLEAWYRLRSGGREMLSASIEDLEGFVEDMVRRFIRTYQR